MKKNQSPQPILMKEIMDSPDEPVTIP